MSTNHTNTGIILVPDDCNLTESMKEQYLLAANYNSDTKEGKEKIEQTIVIPRKKDDEEKKENKDGDKEEKKEDEKETEGQGSNA